MKISYAELKAEFKRVLLSKGIEEAQAEECATMFADTTQDGIFSHGINRFPTFISQLEQGHIIPSATPTKEFTFGAIEQWHANQAIGNLTAKKMMHRATEIADEFGIGVVALKNANHWMRGGSYGLQAARKGYVGICWTNSISALPPWGAKEPRIGTNPLIIAIPSEPVTMIDMSCSMYSYGKLEVHRLAGLQTALDAGFDDEGNLTRDPATVERNRRLLPMGFWKGSGLSIVLDMLASLLSNGKSVADVTNQGAEYGVSQVFIAIAVDKIIAPEQKTEKLKTIIEYIQNAAPADANVKVRLPGHSISKIVEKHQKNGIEVDDSVWNKLKNL